MVSRPFGPFGPFGPFSVHIEFTPPPLDRTKQPILGCQPGDMKMRFPKKTLIDLDWQRLCEHLAERCSGEQAAERCRFLPFLEPEDAWEHLSQVDELVKGMDAGDSPPSLPAHPVDEWLLRIEHQGVVSGEALVRIASNIKLFVSIARYLDNRRDAMPKNAALVVPAEGNAALIKLANLAAELDSAFEPDGSVSDRASVELSRLRARLVSLRKRLMSRLEKLAEKESDLLQERTVSLRNDRFVLPVRADAHRRLQGIVHGTSGSGATIFVEPESAIEAGNDMTLTQEEILREEARIIAELSEAVGFEMEAVRAACRTIVDVETRIAAARLSVSLHAAVPLKGASGSLSLISARHPLLVLAGAEVIPCTVEASSGECIVVSGPNAGGKTVVLKTVGLLGLMLSAGLPIPADAASRLGMPLTVLTDIGDDQSLKENLSTFSAHLTNISRILQQGRYGTIVLLDELAAGTDPGEGAALAEAILEKLCEQEATAFTTTHFDALKTRAIEEGAFKNVAMGFDLGTMRPTFELHEGSPGSSSALEVAKRFGAPDDVIDRARKLMPDEARRLESAILALERSRTKMTEEAVALADARRQAEAIEQQKTKELKRLKEREDKFLDKEREALWQEIRTAREKIRDAEQLIKRQRRDAKVVSRTRQEVNEIQEKLDPGGPFSGRDQASLPGRAAVTGELKPGVTVFVQTFGKEGVVESEPRGKKLFVTIGRLKTQVHVNDLRVVDKGKGDPGKPQTPKLGPAPSLRREDPIQTSRNTVDLRGMMAEEAVDAADAHLDRALREDLGVAFIIHGHGTGALKGAIRTYVADSPYVAEFRPGERGEGGDGVTVVWLR